MDGWQEVEEVLLPDARLKATDIALEMFDQEAKEKIFAKWPYLEAKDSDYAEDQQRGILEKTCRSILERNAGPFWDIISSTLSQELGVTDSTREALDRAIAKARESFEKRLCELERD